MSETWVETINLECKTNGSNKFYNISVIEDPTSNQYIVRCHWGGIGKKGQFQDQHLMTSLGGALYKRSNIIRNKIAKNYIDITEVAKLKVQKEKKKQNPKKEWLNRFSDLLE